MNEQEKLLEEEKLLKLLEDNLTLDLSMEGGVLYAKILFKDKRICACSTTIRAYE